MPSNLVKTRIGQFQQPSTTGIFAAISADAFYLSGTALSAVVASATSSGSITGGANTGTGIGLFSSTANANINIKSLSADAGILITNLGASVSISAALSAGSNIGITQIGNTLSISSSSSQITDGIISYLAL